MATTSTPSTEATTPTVLVDPGVIAGTLALSFVPLTGPQAEAAVRANAPTRIAWGPFVTLKLLLPEESQDVIISGLGDSMLQDVVEALMQTVRGRL